MMKDLTIRIACLGLIASAGTAAGQSLITLPSDFARGDDFVQARFRADTTNFDLRFETDPFPSRGDNTANLTDNRGQLEFSTLGFELSFDASIAELRYTVTRPNGASQTLSLDAAGFAPINLIEFQVTGSAADVTLSDVLFVGGGVTFDAFPDLVTSPNAATSADAALLFGPSVNLFDDNFRVSGSIELGAFTRQNPSERARLNINLLPAGSFVPAPGAAFLAGAAGLLVARRRRR